MATVVFVILMLALSFACLLSLIFMVYSSYLIYVHWMYSHIPGPKRDNFFSGNYPLLQREGKRGKILHEVVEDLRVNYGPVMVIWIYHRPIVFVSDPEVARKCLVTLNLPKNSFGAKNFAFPYGQRFVGNGLVTELDHEVWQKHRSLLNPAFHRRYLMNLMTAFNSSCDLFVNNLDEMADGKTVVDMAEEFARVTMDVIGKVAFDVDLDVIRDKNSPFPAALTETLKGVQESLFAPFWRVDLSSISVQKRLSKTTKFLRDYAKKVIQERQEAISRKDDTPSDILNHILFVAKAEPSLTLEYLVDEFVTFFVAGQETTSNQLSFTLYEILKHPHIQDRIVQEIESVLGSCQFVKYNDLGNLVYLGQTLKEGLRLHSPVGGTSRITVKEEELGGYLVPGNTSVSVSLFVLHHIPEVWPQPKKFDPDRFSPESKISSNALISAYFPFSFGPRTCIGQTFAQFEARVLMARLLQEFELTPLEGQNEIQHEQRLTVKPRRGVLCTIKRRGDNQR